MEKKLDNFFSVCAYTDHCGNLSFIAHVISKYIATFCVVLYYFNNLEKQFSAGNFLIVVVNLITLGILLHHYDTSISVVCVFIRMLLASNLLPTCGGHAI